MSKKRKSYSADFKTKVVLKLLREEESASAIASRYEISVQTLNQWKKKFIENAALAFDVSGVSKEYKEQIEQLKTENEALAKTLGKTTIERDWAVGKLKSLDSSSKRRLVEFKLPDLSVARQCEILGLNRSTLYYEPVSIKEKDVTLMRRIDQIYSEVSCFYGYRRIHAQLRAEGFHIGKHRVHRLMRSMGIEGQRPKRKKRTSVKAKEHKIYPYLLKQFHNEDKQVVTAAANEVWSGDITYIPVKGGFMYLAAIIDWHTKNPAGPQTFQYDGRFVGYRGLGGSDRQIRETQNLQFRSGQPIYRQSTYGTS